MARRGGPQFGGAAINQFWNQGAMGNDPQGRQFGQALQQPRDPRAQGQQGQPRINPQPPIQQPGPAQQARDMPIDMRAQQVPPTPQFQNPGPAQQVPQPQFQNPGPAQQVGPPIARRVPPQYGPGPAQQVQPTAEYRAPQPPQPPIYQQPASGFGQGSPQAVGNDQNKQMSLQQAVNGASGAPGQPQGRPLPRVGGFGAAQTDGSVKF